MSAFDPDATTVRLGAWLEVAGLAVRYYFGPAPASKTVAGTGGTLSYADVPDLDPPGAIRQTLHPKDGIATHDPVMVRIATHGLYAGTNDAGDVFGRLGRRSAEHWCQLTESVPQASGAGADIKVDRDVSAWPFPRLIHMGAEAIWVTGAAGVDPDPGHANPFRFTGVVRGAADTQPQYHLANLVTGQQPFIASDVVDWRTRNAILYVVELDDGGNQMGSPIEYMRGFLQRTPEETPDGLKVSLTIAPMIAKLDTRLAPTSKSTILAKGYHLFDGPHSVVMEHEQFLHTGATVAETAANLAGGSFVIQVMDTARHQASFDPTLGTAHPRAGAVFVAGQGPYALNPAVPYVAGAPGQLNTTAGPPGTGNFPLKVYTGLAGEAHGAEMIAPMEEGVAALMAWPDDVLDAVNAAWSPGTALGAAGAWVDVVVQRDARGYSLAFANNTQLDRGVLCVFGRVREHGPSEGLPGVAERWESGSPRPMASIGQSLSIHSGPVRWNIENGGLLSVDVPIRLDEPFEVPIDVADAFYKTGERNVLVADQLVVPAGGLTVRVDVPGRAEPIFADVDACTPVLDGATVIGYALELRHPDDVPSFADWPGQDPITITPAIRYREQRPGTIMLEVMESAGGNGVNGAYDVLTWGANIPEDAIDEASFLRHTPLPNLELWSPTLPDGGTVGDAIASMLVGSSTAIVMARDDEGRHRITRVSTGPEVLHAARGHIEAGAVLARPESGADEELVARYEIQLGPDAAGEPQDTVVWHDQGAANRFEDAETLSLDFRGLSLDRTADGGAYTRFLPLFARLSEVHGQPVRMFTCRVTGLQGLKAELGAIYTVSSPWLRAFHGLGVAGVGARVIESEIDLFDADGTSIVFLHHGTIGTGWNASCQVTGVAGNVCTVAANAYSDTEDPVTGEPLEDSDGFLVGDQVLVVPACDHDAAVTRTVVGVNRAARTITLNAAPGLVAPDWGFIAPATYASASSHHQVLAYLADGAGELGPSNVDGHELV